MVVEDSADQIPPLRVCNDPVDVFLGRTAVADQDFAGIGREVGRVLLAALENPAAETEKIILPVTLVPRPSSLR